MSKTVTTFCRICLAACGIEVTVGDDNRIERVAPDKENPHSWRDFCGKARTAPELIEHPRRILNPMKRVGDGYVEATWEEAISDIAARLRRIIDRDGPDAVGAYWGNPSGFSSSNVMFLNGFLDAIKTHSRYYVGSVDQNNFHVRLRRHVRQPADDARPRRRRLQVLPHGRDEPRRERHELAGERPQRVAAGAGRPAGRRRPHRRRPAADADRREGRHPHRHPPRRRLGLPARPAQGHLRQRLGAPGRLRRGYRHRTRPGPGGRGRPGRPVRQVRRPRRADHRRRRPPLRRRPDRHVPDPHRRLAEHDRHPRRVVRPAAQRRHWPARPARREAVRAGLRRHASRSSTCWPSRSKASPGSAASRRWPATTPCPNSPTRSSRPARVRSGRSSSTAATRSSRGPTAPPSTRRWRRWTFWSPSTSCSGRATATPTG